MKGTFFMATDDKTPEAAHGEGSVPPGGSTETPQQAYPHEDAYSQGVAYAQRAYVEEPPAGQQAATRNAPYVQGADAAAQDPSSQGTAASSQNPDSQPQAGYDQEHHTPQNPYGQNLVPGQNPYPQGAAEAYSQGAQQAAAYAQSAYTHGAYTHGAYTQGAYTQGAYSQGAQQTGYPQGAPYPPGATPAGYPQPQVSQRPPMDPKKKKKIILFSAIGAGVVLVLIIASVIVNVIGGSQFGPGATVKTYLSAISQGNAAEANKLVDPGVTKNAAALLSDDILGEAKAFMKNAKVTEVTTRGESAYAEVSYSIDGTAFDDIIALSKDGKQGVFFDNWRIDKPLLSAVHVYASQGTVVSVNGKDIDFGKAYDLPAYPASYEIGAPEGDFFEAETQSFVAGTGSKARYEAVEVEFTPSEELTSAVQEALNKHLDACAASATDPGECDMYSGAPFTFADQPAMKYSVEKYPVVTVDESGARFTTEGGKVTATATGTLYGGGTGTETFTTRDDWALTGTIVIDGETVTLEDIY
jgi:hypothetical protein